ncbi:hypothetical protein H8356DRAFT_1324057 [Neocallimastix lanati (nom. inval.)]|nr:hypothetical protein H8356DRAFT_1324057 [Neocallimastix sp. JGI-2020a]
MKSKKLLAGAFIIKENNSKTKNGSSISLTQASCPNHHTKDHLLTSLYELLYHRNLNHNLKAYTVLHSDAQKFSLQVNTT